MLRGYLLNPHPMGSLSDRGLISQPKRSLDLGTGHWIRFDSSPDSDSDLEVTPCSNLGSSGPKAEGLQVHYTAESLDSDPGSLEEAKSRSDWPMWENVLEVEYNFLRKHKVFGPTISDLDKRAKGHRLIFTKKYDASGTVMRYKVYLVAHGFLQSSGVDFDQTYSPIMYTLSFRFVLALVVQLSLHIFFLDVVTGFLHGVIIKKIVYCASTLYSPHM